MGHLLDFIVGTVISVILYVFIFSVGQNITADLEFNDKIQKGFVINFVVGLCLLCLAYTTFSKDGKLYNRAMRTGLLLSGFALLINTIVINWYSLSDNTRTLLIGVCLGLSIWYAYSLASPSKKKRKIKKKIDDEYTVDDAVGMVDDSDDIDDVDQMNDIGEDARYDDRLEYIE